MTVEDIEKPIADLPPKQLAEFRAWFEAFDAERFDQSVERDAKAGKLDRSAEQALDDLRKGTPASYEALGEPRVLGRTPVCRVARTPVHHETRWPGQARPSQQRGAGPPAKP
jgi:hypothetical protein